MENIRLLYESQEAVIRLFNDYSSFVSEVKYKTIHGKGLPSMSTRVARGWVAEVLDHANLKILSHKQMLPIALVQVKAGNTFHPHRLSLNLSDKINLRRRDRYVALSNNSIYYTWKNIKSHAKTINLKYQLRHGV